MYNIVLSGLRSRKSMAIMAITEMAMCDFRSAGVVFLASSIYFYKHWIERMCAAAGSLMDGGNGLD